METVLGLSVTATNIQTVLVEGREADGATLEHDEFNVFADGVSAARASEQVAEAVLSIAQADGHHLRAIGVTWSDDADLEASLVMDSLADMGFSNVVAVRSPRAAEALARSIGRVIGYQRTAVCVIEPDNVILSLFDTIDGEMGTSVSHAIDNDDQLARWMNAAFERHDWRPEGLFVVGSVGGLDALAHWLEHELGLPVFDPPEAELALAHGAALASASGAERLDAGVAVTSGRRFPVGPVSMLVAGAVTFVVSVSLAVSPHLTSERTSFSVPAPAQKSAVTPPVAKMVPPPAAPVTPAPLPEAPAPIAELPEDLPEVVPEAPVEDVPAYEPGPAVEAALPPAPAAPIEPINPIAPPPAVVAPPPPPPVPVQPPRLRDKIIDKIPGLNRFN